jgi:hypothetical protein
MLFISYWELNPDFDPSEMAEIAQKLVSKQLYPAEGVKSIGWYVSTSDYWGISIDEAESEEQLAINSQMWRIAKPGFIKFMRTSPAMEAIKILPILMKLKKQLE